MKISVLIPYYNDREYLSKSIESVLNQTYKDFELILINHATTDDCREIAHSYNDSRIVHLDMDKNYYAGTGLIVKKFLEHATGDYVKLFCADDIMYPDGLESLVKYAYTNPEKDIIFGDIEHIDKNGKSLNNSWFNSRFGFNVNNTEVDCLRHYFQGHSIFPYIGSFVKTSKIKPIELDVSSIMLFDMQLWSSMLISGCKVGYLNKYIAGYRIHENQMCSNSNEDKAIVRGMYENAALSSKYLNINDINLIKKVFRSNPYIEKADNNDIKFIVSYEMLLSDVQSTSYVGYYQIHNMLQDEQTRAYLEKKFNFGIIEFRKIYSHFPSGSMLNHSEYFIYMLIKRFLKKITFYKIRQKSSKKIM